MTTRDIVFALLAAAIAFVSNALILEIQDALTFRSLASRSAIPGCLQSVLLFWGPILSKTG